MDYANNPQLITEQMIIDRWEPEFGFAENGVFYTKRRAKTRRLGYVSDYRRMLQTEFKNAKNAIIKKEESASIKCALVKDTMRKLQSVFKETDAKVFINQTMPNVHLNGYKYYFIISATGFRLSITHPKHDMRLLNKIYDYVCLHNDTIHNVIISNLTLNDAIAIIKRLK